MVLEIIPVNVPDEFPNAMCPKISSGRPSSEVQHAAASGAHVKLFVDKKKIKLKRLRVLTPDVRVFVYTCKTLTYYINAVCGCSSIVAHVFARPSCHPEIPLVIRQPPCSASTAHRVSGDFIIVSTR